VKYLLSLDVVQPYSFAIRHFWTNKLINQNRSEVKSDGFKDRPPTRTLIPDCSWIMLQRPVRHNGAAGSQIESPMVPLARFGLHGWLSVQGSSSAQIRATIVPNLLDKGTSEQRPVETIVNQVQLILKVAPSAQQVSLGAQTQDTFGPSVDVDEADRANMRLALEQAKEAFDAREIPVSV
jgi:hypothetical protein